MLLEAIYHRPKLNWAYAYDQQTIHLRIRTKRDDVDTIKVCYGDKFAPWEMMRTLTMTKLTHDTLFDYWEAHVVPPFRRLSYGFTLHAGNELICYTERGFQADPLTEHSGMFEYPFVNPIDVFKPPTWVKDAVFYQIFPERFANGDHSNDPLSIDPWGDKPNPHNFFGGDLQGVRDHLDYLTELGVNAIYFTPVFQATTNHKYDTQDYLQVDAHFGDNQLLKTLTEECHARGIRILLDAVFNHCGKTFAPFVDVMEKGAASPYAEMFHVKQFPLTVIDGIPTYDTFSFEPIMPKLNTENPEVKKYLLQVARYWIKEIGIDGWRLDVANEVDHAFWRDFRKVVKSANPDAYILGEIFHDSIMWLQGDQFDAVMNYRFTSIVLDFFTKNKLDGFTFASGIGNLLASYPQQANEVAFNLLDSHDTARLLTLCNHDKRVLKLAVLFQFTYPGTPCIYYGDEVGMDGEGDPDCRKCMIWEPEAQDQELFQFYKQLIALRKANSALRTGSFQFLHVEREDAGIVYERRLDEEHIVIILNHNDQPKTFTLPLLSGSWINAWSGQPITLSDISYSTKLKPYGWAILIKVNP